MKVNQLKAGSMLSFILMFLGYIISLIYTPIMLRLLGQNEYGLYNLVVSVVSYLGVLNFGLGSAYIRYYLKLKTDSHKEEVAKLNGLFLLLFGFIGLIAVIAGTVLFFNVDWIFGNQLTASEVNTAKILVIVLIMNLAISFPNIVFNSYITANEKFVFQKLVEGVKIIGSPFVVLPVLIMGWGSIGMALATTLLTLIMEIFNIIYCLKKLNMKFLFNDLDKSLLKEVSVFSWYVFLTMVVGQINWNVDKYILGLVGGTSVVAVYGLAAQLKIYFNSFSTAITRVFIPRFNRIVNKPDNRNELSKLFIKVGRIQYIVLFLITSGFLFFGKPFINMWAGAEYSEVYYITLIMFFPLLMTLIQNSGVNIQKAMNKHQFRSIIYVIVAIVNLIITIPLSIRFGAIGAASGTAFTLIIGDGLLMNWYYQTKIGLDIIGFWKQIFSFLPSTIIPVIFGVAVNTFLDLNNLIYFTISGFSYVVIYLVSFWCLGLNQFERQLIIDPIRSFRKKNVKV